MSNNDKALLSKEMFKDLRGDISRKLEELTKAFPTLSMELLFRNACAMVLQEYSPKAKGNRIAYA